MGAVRLRSAGLLSLCVIACVSALTAAPALALPASFGTEGSGAGQVLNPRGIAVDQESGDVYVADTENNRIDKFGPEGEFLLAWGWGVADGSTEALQICTTTCFKGLGGEFFKGSGAGEFNGAEGIAVDSSLGGFSHGDVYVADTRNNRVEKFGPEGEFLLMFGGKVNETKETNVCTKEDIEGGDKCGAGVPGEGSGAFKGLTRHAVAVDATTGTVYVGDESRVQRFSEAGAVESEIAFLGSGLLEHLAVDSAKDIYLQSSNRAGVRKYDGSGTELPPPRDEAGFGEALAIANGPSDELFVNDLQESHHILTYNAEGEQTASFDAGGEAQDVGRRGIAYSEKLKALYVVNSGTVRIVTPPPPGPFILIGSESVSKVEPTTATLGAMINPEGPPATSYHFEYDTTPYAEGEAPHGQSTGEVELKGGQFADQPASAAIKELLPSTTYHFRAVATNGSQTSEGPDQSFTTLPPVSIDATSVSEVNDKSARLQAELNPHGLSSEYRFEYDTTPYAEGEAEHGIKVPMPDGSVGAGTTDTTVSNLIQGLSPSTTYHYRVIAHNELGEVEGPDRSFTTQGASSILPDGRAWELVSPPNKHGSPLEPITEEGGLIQAAAGGGGMAYVALGPVNGEPKGVRSPTDSQLLASRSSRGWETQDITTPHEEIRIIHAGFPSEYKLFAEDLSAGVVEPEGVTPLSSQTSERTPYRREADGEFVPLVTASNVPPGTKFANDVEFRTATPDLSHVVLVSSQVLAPGFGPGFEPEGRPNVYELSGGSLRLISVLPSGEAAAQAGQSAGVGHNDLNMRGALSSDGNRVVFETGASGHLYMREVSLGQTLQLDEPQPGAAGGAGEAVFQGASSDGARVFFTDASQLTADATAKPGQPDLYMCEIGESAGHLSCTLSDLTVDHNVGEAANVPVPEEVSAIDASGGHVYFAANGVLTSTPNAQGEHAVPGVCNSAGEATCNLYEYDTSAHEISLVAVLSSRDGPDWAGHGDLDNLGNLTARSSPNGRYFTFMSQRSLTGYDNRDARSGQPDAEVFLFDSSSGKLSCASCNPTGARPEGVFDKEAFPGLLVDHPQSWRGRWLAGSIPGWTLQWHNLALYQSRYLSNSGRMFFNAADALVPQDTNNVEDVYQYEPPGVGDCSSSSTTFSAASGGCVNLISSGASKEESAFLDASQSGDEVFFLTASRLTTSDVDPAFDVYDAHVCSASSPCPPPPPPPPPACEGDACQSPSSPPNDSTPGSLTYQGPGNAAPAPVVKAKPKPLTRAQKLTKALKACRSRHNRRKRAACEKSARKRYGASKAKRSAHHINRRAK